MKKRRGFNLIKINEERHMVITPVGRVSFPQVFTARSFEDNPEAEKCFQVDLIFDDKEEFKKEYKGKKKQTISMARAVINAKQDQWGDKSKWPRFNYPCFKDGNERVDQDQNVLQGYADKYFITARSKEQFPPKVIDAHGKELTEQEFYGGCYARAQLIARPYAFGKNFGIRFILLQIMKTDEGERFGGVADDVFDLSEEDDEDWDTDEDNDEDVDL